MMKDRRFYSIGSCVRVRRTDEATNEHDEFVADARNAKHAQDIADALNKETPDEHSRSIETSSR